LYTVSVTVTGGGGLHVHPHIVVGGSAVEGFAPTGTAEPTEELDEGPRPIAPEPKELLWGLGAFLVFLVLMRLVLFPKVKAGMTARYGVIRAGHERAESLREEAKREVADYEQALAAVRADGASRVEAASRQLEAERAERVGAVSAAIAERRSAAATEREAAKAAARGSIEAAVVDVAARAVELSIGRRPDDAVVRRAAVDAMGVGVGT